MVAAHDSMDILGSIQVYCYRLRTELYTSVEATPASVRVSTQRPLAPSFTSIVDISPCLRNYVTLWNKHEMYQGLITLVSFSARLSPSSSPTLFFHSCSYVDAVYCIDVATLWRAAKVQSDKVSNRLIWLNKYLNLYFSYGTWGFIFAIIITNQDVACSILGTSMSYKK